MPLDFHCFPAIILTAGNGYSAVVARASKMTEATGDGYKKLPVILVDDDQQTLLLLQKILHNHGFQNVHAFSGSQEAMAAMDAIDAAVIVLDLQMPQFSGKYLLDKISQNQDRPAVIIVTAENQIDTAVHCIKKGADDYLTKPVSVTRFLSAIHRALEVRELSGELDSLRESKQSIKIPDGVEFIVTADREVLKLLKYIEIVANSHQPLLITGETGVGKELFARAFHTLSKRSGQFVSINIAGLDDTMFSDTLFGHKKGAYTGATYDRDGLIKKSAAGTLFLDEIGDLNELSQIKLLRLLQENEYFPLGSDIPEISQASLVVATNQDLKQRMMEGTFRKDLYYRLYTHQITIPPLRNRPDDIPVLLQHFISHAAKIMGKPAPLHRKELLQLLLTYDFPGNVRELQAMVYDAVAKSSSRLSSESFSEKISREQGYSFSDAGSADTDFHGITFNRFPTLRQADEELIRKALEISKGNQKIAGQLLGITRQALNNRLRRSHQNI